MPTSADLPKPNAADASTAPGPALTALAAPSTAGAALNISNLAAPDPSKNPTSKQLEKEDKEAEHLGKTADGKKSVVEDAMGERVAGEEGYVRVVE